MSSTMLKFSILALIVGSVLSKKEVGDPCLVKYGTEEGFDGVFHYFELPSQGGKCANNDLV